MLKNYLTIAFRNLLRHKLFSLINILGLASGLVCCSFILLYVQHELSYDKYHQHAPTIYRVVKDFVNKEGDRLPDATTPPALAVALQKDLPEVEKVVRLFPNWGIKYLVKYKDNQFYEEKLYRADPSIFDVFTFPFLKGDPTRALQAPNSIVLTESAARKYFGEEDPFGKLLQVDVNEGSFLVTGIIKDIPSPSHFSFDFLIPFSTLGKDLDQSWGSYNYYTYVKLKSKDHIASFDAKLQALFASYQPESKNIFYSQALTDIHLRSHLKWELSSNGDARYVRILITIAIFVIFMACCNYVNLATARSANRAKEVGIRKVSGAVRWALIKQFLAESLLMAWVSAAVAALFVILLMPLFNNLTEKSFDLFTKEQVPFWLLVCGIASLVGLLAGIYPALYLSSFEAVKVLKGQSLGSRKFAFLRKSLVSLQFVISISLIIGTIIITKQIAFIQTAKLGFDKEQVLVLPNSGGLANRDVIKQQLSLIPSVVKVGASSGVLGGMNWTTGMSVKGSEKEVLMNYSLVDYEYVDALGLELMEGRKFARAYGSDSSNALIINEKAVKELGLTHPIGKQLILDQTADTVIYATVIGVVKDFHFTSFHQAIKPFAFAIGNTNPTNMFIKVNSKDMEQTLRSLKASWESLVADRPFDYYFLDESYQRLHKSEERFQTIFSYMTSLAIFISCLGLFALAAYMAERRTKEIGIRKVLGASLVSILGLLSGEFIILTLIAFLLAAPISWFAMEKWLENFAYRIDISFWIFILAGICSLLIALLAVGYQAIKAALANPVKSLRNE